MDKKTFAGTVRRLIYDHPSLSPDYRRSTCGSGGDSPATVETMLSATLRYCAGGAWQDIVDMHGIARSTFRRCVKKATSPFHILAVGFSLLHLADHRGDASFISDGVFTDTEDDFPIVTALYCDVI